MPKQRGVYQIAGRINDLVYYEQKYIKGGLIRRQNLAMGDRVKNDAVFEGTRVANSLNGGCMMMAAALLDVAGRRESLMQIPSRISRLTASILRMYETENGPDKIANIDLSKYSPYEFIVATDLVAKNQLSEWFPTIPRVIKNVERGGNIEITLSSYLLETYCKASGVQSCQIEIMGASNIGESVKDTYTEKFTAPTIIKERVIGGGNWILGRPDLTLTARAGDYESGFTCIYIMVLPRISGAGSTARFKISKALGGYCVINYV